MKADRLLSALLVLQAHGKQTGRELAARLEVSERTVHRDMEALSAAGLRVLVDRDDPGRLFIVAEFASVEPGVSAVEEAERNNDRPETQSSAARIIALSTGEPEYHHFDEVYRTDPFSPGLGHRR